MNTVANAVLFTDGLEADHAAWILSLNAWVEQLVDVGVLDIRIVATPISPILAAEIEKFNRRGSLWLSVGTLEPDCGNDTDLVIVGSLSFVPDFSLGAAIKSHLRQGGSSAVVSQRTSAERPRCFLGESRLSWLGSSVRVVFIFDAMVYRDVARAKPETTSPMPPMYALRSDELGCPTHLSRLGKRPAVFLDRDGTIIEDADYLSDPTKIRFFPESAPAIKRLREAGYACVLISNQSGVGRGKFSEAQMHTVHRQFLLELARMGAALDGAFYCPLKPTVKSSTEIDHPDRKPGPGMLLRAAAELDLDLAASWMIGDSARDLVAGRNAGCRDCLFVESGKSQSPEDLEICRTYTGVANLQEAADRILTSPSASVR